MSIELGFFETRVARRLFLRFVLCAVVPIGVLAGLSYATVTANLRERGDLRLQEVATATERSVRNRLDRARDDLGLLVGVIEVDATLGPSLTSSTSLLTQSANADSSERLAEVLARLPRPEGFASLAVTAAGYPSTVVFGDAPALSGLSASQLEHLADGKALLVEVDGTPKQIWLGKALRTPGGDSRVMWAELDRDHLWEIAAHVASPALAEATFLSGVETAVSTRDGSLFGWVPETEGAFRSATRSIVLGEEYSSPDWHVVVSVPERAVLAPLQGFAVTFLPLVFLSLVAVTLFSSAQIRRMVRPLQELHEATRRVGSEDFDTRVNVSTDDEIQDLVGAFNSMTASLGQQFTTLTAMQRLDRVGLSATTNAEVFDTLLQTLLTVQNSDAVSVCTFAQAPGDETVSRAVVRVGPEVNIVHRFECDPWELVHLEGVSHVLIDVESRKDLPCFLRVPPFNDLDHRRFLVTAVDPSDLSRGLVCFASTDASAFTEEEIRRVRHLIDQAAPAFSNVDRMNELSHLDLGALSALARSIDASSPWTVGHSERVTRIAIALGRVLALTDEELDTLGRGGLLHDIGKIGVPVEILNKPSALTDAEFDRVKEHVTIGARILEPITAFADLLPVVLSHHERMDGNGYPHGLTGEEIPFLARIIAVADTFDALTSDRPYRRGLPFRTAVEIVRNAAGSQLDTNVVDAFMTLVDEDSMELDLMADNADTTIDYVWDDLEHGNDPEPQSEDEPRTAEHEGPAAPAVKRETKPVRVGPKVAATL